MAALVAPRFMRILYVGALLWLCGCHYDIELGRKCAPDAVGCSVSTLLLDAGKPLPPIAAEEFHIEIQGLQGRSVTGLQQSCDGSCQNLTAIAIGGTAPYVWHWENGGSSPERRVCAEPPHVLHLDATDSATPARHASAELTLSQTSCLVTDPVGPPPAQLDQDAGMDDDAVTACRALDWQQLPDELITESIEGPPRACQSTDGFTFIEGVVPWPLRAGRMFMLHSMTQNNWFGRWRLEVWGSSGGCELVEKLGEFQVSAAASRSVMLTPKQDHAFLALRVVVNAGRLITPTIEYQMCPK